MNYNLRTRRISEEDVLELHITTKTVVQELAICRKRIDLGGQIDDLKQVGGTTAGGGKGLKEWCRSGYVIRTHNDAKESLGILKGVP